MVLSNHSMVFVCVSSPRTFFASRSYNYSLCGVFGRKTWKAYLECLYCKVKAWIHGGKQHTNIIKSASVWIWVEGWLLKDFLFKPGRLRSWAIFDAHPLFFCSTLFFFHLALFSSSSFPAPFFLTLFFSQHIAHVPFQTCMENGERSWIHGVFIFWKGEKGLFVRRWKGMCVLSS